MVFNFDKKPIRVSFSVVQSSHGLTRPNTIVFIVFCYLRNTSVSPYSYYYYTSCLERLQPNQDRIDPKKLLNYLKDNDTQCSGYLNFSFCNKIWLLFRRIDHEAMKARANAHPQNFLPGKDIKLKSTQTFLKKHL